MSDPQIPEDKKFAFGELNDVSPSYAQRRLSTQSEDPIAAMRDAAISHYTPNALEGVGPYKGVVLKVLDPPSPTDLPPGDWLFNVFGSTEEGGSEAPPYELKRYKVRIPEIHAMLPEPSAYDQGESSSEEDKAIISRYPTFVAADSNVAEASAGDLVWVDFGNRKNQTDPTFVGPVFPPPENSAGGGGNRSQNAHGPCGNLGGSPSSGGSLSPDQRARLQASGENYGNAIYLPRAQIRARNMRSPTRGQGGGHVYYSRQHASNYVAAGGSGLSVSGRMAPGSCSNIRSRLARITKARTIVCEDYSDRGYFLGGRGANGTDRTIGGCRPGGIDCSGFCFAVRVLAEKLCGEGYYGLPNNVDKENWWTGYTPYSAYYIGGSNSAPEPAQHTNVMVVGNQPGASQITPWDFNAVPPMPGDDIAMATLTVPPPSFCRGRFWRDASGNRIEHKISHVVTCFVDPEGHLRVSESGGPFKGVGSRRWEEWIASAARGGRNLWCMQSKEMERAWAEAGGRPTTPWTASMARQMIPEFFNDTLNARAAGATETSVPTTDGSTSSDGETPSTENSASTSSGETPSTASASGPAAAASTEQTEAQQRQATAREQLPAKQAAYETKRTEILPAPKWSDGQARTAPQIDQLAGAITCPSAPTTSPTFTAPEGCSDASLWNQVAGAWCEFKETERTANGQNNNAASSTSGSATPSAVGGSCRSGQAGAGGGGRRNRPTRPIPPATPPQQSTEQDAAGIPMYEASKLGELDNNRHTSTRRSGYDFIVIHDGGYHPRPDQIPRRRQNRGATAIRDVINQWQNSGLGTHYYITYDGTVWQLMSERLTCAHAGCSRSEFEGQCMPNVNRRSIAIDLQAPTDNQTTQAQYRSLTNLVRNICRRRNIPMDDKHVVAHFQAKKRNHHDPRRGFRWSSVGGMTYDHYERDGPSTVPGMWANWPNAGGSTPPSGSSSE